MPTDIPAINGGGAVVGDGDGSGEAGAPFAIEGIAAIGGLNLTGQGTQAE